MGVVVGVVVAAVVDVVVVVAPTVVWVVVVVFEHTEMVTVWGNGGFSTVPAPGLWLCTWPAVPPLEEQSTCVNVGFSPGVLEIAVPAADCESPTTFGTVAEHGPFDTTMLTGVFGGCWVPAAGVWEATFPAETCCEQAELCVPTVRLLAGNECSRPMSARARRHWGPEPRSG